MRRHLRSTRMPSDVDLHAQIFADAPGRDESTACDGVDRWCTGALERGMSVVAAEEDRREIDDEPVDEARRHEGVRDGRPALDEQMQHAALAEVVQEVLERTVV